MIRTTFRAGQLALARIGQLTMYRQVLYSLALLAAIALVLSLCGLVVPTATALLITAAVLVVVSCGVDAVAHRVIRRPWRPESSLITAGILLFVLFPDDDLAALPAIALAAAVAALSKYVIAWRGRHLLNPAAFGAAVVTATGWGASAWWVGSPWLFVSVMILGGLILWRTEKLLVVGIFWTIATALFFARVYSGLIESGSTMTLEALVTLVIVQSPILFLGTFMLSEPLTLPGRRWQQILVAAVVGILVGWPLDLGVVTLSDERALLVGNVLAFLLARRAGLSLTLSGRRQVTPTVTEVALTAGPRFRFEPGQYLELEVPHRSVDSRGNRREFSLVSTPAELPQLRLAYRDRSGNGTERRSSLKTALAGADVGTRLYATGVWGDFVAPRSSPPELLIAGGIGVTPFVSRIAAANEADIVLAYVASRAGELAYRDELERASARVVVFTPDNPGPLADGWVWAGGVRLTAESLGAHVPDLTDRHVSLSGPPRTLADILPAVRAARSVRTDSFSGY